MISYSKCFDNPDTISEIIEIPNLEIIRNIVNNEAKKILHIFINKSEFKNNKFCLENKLNELCENINIYITDNKIKINDNKIIKINKILRMNLTINSFY